LIDGATPVSEVAPLLGFSELPEKDAVTVAGLVLAQADHLPKMGEQFSCNGWRFEVAELDGARISKVLARPLSPAQGRKQ